MLKKVVKKSVDSVNENELSMLLEEFDACVEKSDKLIQRRIELNRRIGALRLLPFKEGDVVIYSYNSGRFKVPQEKKCQLEIGSDENDFYIRAKYFKNDGTVSEKYLVVSPPEDWDYSSVFRREI